MSPSWRSAAVAALGGMMAAAYLHSQGIVDLGFGFPRGSLIEGLLMAATGASGGLALLFAFRLLRALVERLKT